MKQDNEQKLQANERQLQAIMSDHPRILTIAGAGTGKTMVLTARVARLLERGVSAARMLCVTFTRAAAAEMRERVAKATSVRYLPEIRTVHSWCARLLRAYPEAVNRTSTFTIYDQRDSDDLLRVCAQDLKAVDNPHTCRISTLRRREQVVQEYEARLAQANALDFDQLEGLALGLLQDNDQVRDDMQQRYQHILVDEYQDTNFAQAAIFQHLTPISFFVVGDPRQSIYRFRGADVGIILEAAADADFQVVQLVDNYRSKPSIVDAANGIMAHPFEPMRAHREQVMPGPVPAYLVDDEPTAVAKAVEFLVDLHEGPQAVAVLARQWKALVPIRDLLQDAGIPVRYLGAEEDPWETTEGRALARALLLYHNHSDINLARWLDAWGNGGNPRCGDFRDVRIEVASSRRHVVDVLAEQDPTGTWSDFQGLRAHHMEGDDVIDIAGAMAAVFRGPPDGAVQEAIDAIPEDVRTLADWIEWWTDRSVQERKASDDEAEAVTLSTVHGAKGLEWPAVVLVGVNDGIYPTNRKTADDDDRAEDRRVFYVGVTRARDSLLLTVPTEQLMPWGKMKAVDPSPYLTDAGIRLGSWEGVV